MERYTFLMTPPQLHDTVQGHCSGRSGGELSSRHSDTLTTLIILIIIYYNYINNMIYY